MKDPRRELQNAQDAIDEVSSYVDGAIKDFESIANLARDIDDSNWQEVSQKIFDIAYQRY